MSSSLNTKSKFDHEENNHASIVETQAIRLSSELNSMTMAGKSGSSKSHNKEKIAHRVDYKPEKWMLPDQTDDRLTQLNLAIVSLM